MDIGGLSMSLNQGKLAQAVSLSLMKITMNTSKENAVQMTEMIKESVNPNIGQNIDLKG
ncbi:YjfB family protein [Clostridium sporogenes]|uniref:Motility protein n=1 Tax=Clostridium sporogenes TaxID=1509 RepID=A0ABD6RN30_CLOSG|nr:YjfB family protein [Clostridium sporogenes]MCW6086844.1 YjfB family protein [Clostridium sporogenes]NFH47095.1 putative motility protein [Clostridium sporogenes]OSB16870.1 putative motility protein [Clostridium sporogenes]STC82089.1 putative motility protein [Clostridium botulinum]